MSENEPDRASDAPDPPSPELLLAAAERAECHDAREQPGVPSWVILEHLELRKRSPGARAAHAQLRELRAGGSIERLRRHGVDVWSLTDAGRARLQAERRAGRAPLLPESPQHRAWRDARRTSALEIERFRATLRQALSEAAGLLAADTPPHSDNWFELAERLRRACRLIGSAGHCLYEWSEPDDDRPDLDCKREPGDEQLPDRQRARRRSLRTGRRNIRVWEDPDLPSSSASERAPRRSS